MFYGNKRTVQAAGLIRLAAVVALFGTPLAASEPSAWGTSGMWEVLVNPDNGNGCFARRTLEDGTIIEMGTVPNRRGGFVAAYNATWTPVKEGEFGTVEFDFGDAIFAGEATAQSNDGAPGGYAFFDNPAFPNEFAKRRSVTVSRAGGPRYQLDLTGSSNAIQAVYQCQSEQPQ